MALRGHNILADIIHIYVYFHRTNSILIQGDIIVKKMIKNMEHETPIAIADEISYQPGQIVSKTISQNQHHSLTLFALDIGEEISTHKSEGDAMVLILDGKGKITIDGKEYIVNKEETIIMPAQKPHSVFAVEQFKMLLIVIFPENENG